MMQDSLEVFSFSYQCARLFQLLSLWVCSPFGLNIFYKVEVIIVVFLIHKMCVESSLENLKFHHSDY